MNWIILYGAAVVAFLGVDFVWLRNVMRPLFEREVGDLLRDTMRVEAAAGFYLLYVAGVLFLATAPGLRQASAGTALLNGAIIGFLAYGTYEATNMTTLRGWTWQMVLTDTAWGIFLTAMVSVGAYALGRSLGMGAG